MGTTGHSSADASSNAATAGTASSTSTTAEASEPQPDQYSLQLLIGCCSLLFGFPQKHHRLLQRQHLLLLARGHVAAGGKVVIVARRLNGRYHGGQPFHRLPGSIQVC